MGTADAGPVNTATFDAVPDSDHDGKPDSAHTWPRSTAAIGPTLLVPMLPRVRQKPWQASTTMVNLPDWTSIHPYPQVTLTSTMDADIDADIIGHDLALRFVGAIDSAITENVSIEIVPDPGSLALMGLGSLLMLVRVRRDRSARTSDQPKPPTTPDVSGRLFVGVAEQRP